MCFVDAVVRGTIVVSSSNTAVQIGGNAMFQCSTNCSSAIVRWSQISRNFSDSTPIYNGFKTVENFQPRFNIATVKLNSTLCVNKLFIFSVTQNDSGFYACMEVGGRGVKHAAELIVVCTCFSTE